MNCSFVDGLHGRDVVVLAWNQKFTCDKILMTFSSAKGEKLNAHDTFKSEQYLDVEPDKDLWMRFTSGLKNLNGTKKKEFRSQQKISSEN